MAVQYVVTEEEFLSLIDQLKIERLKRDNISSCDGKTPDQMRDSIHRGFHFVVTRWVQAMGCKGYRP
jgi:hypothetical protein